MAINASVFNVPSTVPISTDATPPTTIACDVENVAKLDASKLKITFAKSLKPLPDFKSINFGEEKTDHMLVMSFDPKVGWSAPEIKPYAPLELDPMSSCFHYATCAFEGLKAYLGPDGKPRLFRPKDNMARFTRSIDRLALPPFDENALLEVLKKFISVESRWIYNNPGASLYVRPTVIGTKDVLGVRASDHAMIYVIVTPWGKYFQDVPKAVSLLAVDENIRAWPGGTGSHKLSANYGTTFLPQREAVNKGYDQILWLLGEGDEKRVTEAGVMNFFVVVRRDDGDLDILTPPLDGTILPGITRASCLDLIAAHAESPLPYVSERIYAHEVTITIKQLNEWSKQGKLIETFGVGTAAVVAPVGRIGYDGKDIMIPEYNDIFGPVSKSLNERILDIQHGKAQWKDWCVTCE